MLVPTVEETKRFRTFAVLLVPPIFSGVSQNSISTLLPIWQSAILKVRLFRRFLSMFLQLLPPMLRMATPRLPDTVHLETAGQSWTDLSTIFVSILRDGLIDFAVMGTHCCILLISSTIFSLCWERFQGSHVWQGCHCNLSQGSF